MVHIIGNRRLMELICSEENIPQEVVAEAYKALKILEINYNCERMPYQCGGFIGIIQSVEDKLRQELLDIYGLSPELAEFDDELVKVEGYCWHQQYYQVATEYGITLFFCVPIKEDAT